MQEKFLADFIPVLDSNSFSSVAALKPSHISVILSC